MKTVKIIREAFFYLFFSSVQLTYLMNPDYPEATNASDDCVFRVELLPSVCQVRLGELRSKLNHSFDLKVNLTQSLESDPSKVTGRLRYMMTTVATFTNSRDIDFDEQQRKM